MRRPADRCLLSAAAALAVLVLSGCDGPPAFRQMPTDLDCRAGSCLVTFGIENLLDESLVLDFEATLSREAGQEPADGRTDVGAVRGRIRLAPRRQTVVSRSVTVTDAPGGSVVRVRRVHD